MNIWSVTDGAPFCQVAIDARRMSVLNALFQRWKKKPTDKDALKPKYLWYPKPNTMVYELRDGEPPPDSERPSHLKGKDLRVMLGEVVDKIMRVCKDPDVKDGFDVSVQIAKLTGVTLPAFSPGHVALKKQTEAPAPTASRIHIPTRDETRLLGGV